MILKKGDPVGWLFTSLSALLGGLYFPISVLPEWLFRRKNLLNLSVQNAAQDARFLVLSLWLASLSVLAYIAFTFGKR